MSDSQPSFQKRKSSKALFREASIAVGSPLPRDAPIIVREGVIVFIRKPPFELKGDFRLFQFFKMQFTIRYGRKDYIPET